MVAIYVTIGNSDDKLSQRSWALFVADIVHFVNTWSSDIHGQWYSTTDSPWQNACYCFELYEYPESLELMRADLRLIAHRWSQDSIAMAVVNDVELVRPGPRPVP